MPWETTFDEEDVLNKAMTVFWEKGYDSTSISDLTAATGIQRGSLYNTFQGKKDLFLKSLLKYDAEYCSSLLRELEAMDDPIAAFTELFNGAVRKTTTDPDRKGCMLVNTSLTLSQHDIGIQKIVKGSYNESIRCFERLIHLGQEREVIPLTVDPKSTARAILSLLVGMSVMGRGVLNRSALQHAAKQGMSLIS